MTLFLFIYVLISIIRLKLHTHEQTKMLHRKLLNLITDLAGVIRDVISL